MEQVVISIFMLLFVLWEILVLDLVLRVSGNAEVDTLNALKSSMSDPNNLIQSWDSTLVTPCQWDRVTCNAENSVIRVDLGDANLSGQLVPQLGQLQNLQYLELYSNNITGKIPDDLGSLINLVSLDLSLNNITGSIPDNLANLKKLRFLRLNNNSLSGKIPVSLTSVSSLQVLDLSNNNLTGDVPANGSFSFFTSTSFKNNPLLNQTVPTPRAPTLQQNPSAFNSHVNRAIVVAVGVALLFGVLVIPLVYWRRRKDYFFDVSAEEDPEVHLTQPRRFSLRDLQIATDNFHRKNLIGRGKFGMVYKGRLINGEPVAIQRLKQKHKYTERSLIHFQVELETTSMIVHPNLLRLRGFCMTPTERLLVHPFMVNGSVASSLRDRSESQPPLDWHKRKRIALGAARGLAYLHDHCDPMVIHRDVKASNIFLDEENEAVVGDFGLIRLMNHKDTHVTSPVCGTIGHIPPEYLSSGKTSEKTDVYGYGVTLLEIITGRRAFDLARLADDDDLLFLDWIKVLKDKRLETLVDADLEGNFEEKEVKELIQVALLCIPSSPLKRPKMSEVVRMLEGEGLAEKWDKWLQNEDIIQQNLHIVDMNSTSNISPEEPSGPMIFELKEIV